MIDGISEDIEGSSEGFQVAKMIVGTDPSVHARRLYDKAAKKQYREHWEDGVWVVVATKAIRRILVEE
jgi:hypothetical protein